MSGVRAARVALLRLAARLNPDPGQRERLTAAADRIADQPDPHPLPGDRPLFEPGDLR